MKCLLFFCFLKHIIQLSNNSITGTIPISFASGKYLTTVNLAYNR